MKPSTLKSENLIKGDIAESIVARLFRELRFHVIYNGIEVTHPELLILRDKNLIDRHSIRRDSSKADLIVVREHDAAHSALRLDVEVKFSRSSKIKKEKLLPYHHEVHFVFLDFKHLWSTPRKQVIKNNSDGTGFVEFNTLTRLEDDPVFGFTDEQKLIIRNHKKYISSIQSLDEIGEPKSPVKSAKDRTLPSEHGSKWASEDDEKLKEEFLHLSIKFDLEQTIKLLCLQFDRSRGGIRARLKKLELIAE